MRALARSLIAVVALVPSIARPQASPIPQTISGCMAAFRSDRSAARAQTAHRCADRVVAAGLRKADVPMLAALYDSAHDAARAQAHRLLRDLDVRIAAAGVSVSQIDHPTPGEIATADALLARLDSLPSSVSDLQLLAHRKFLAIATATDDHPRAMARARRVIALAHTIRPRTARLDEVIADASGDLAQEFGVAGRADSALAVLNRARAGVDSVMFVREGLARDVALYSLVGRTAPSIAADHWLNAAGHSAGTFGRGRVTLVQFTGVACAPCRASYPAMSAVYKRFDRARFDLLFVTWLTGEFEGRKMSPAAELSATSDYYTKRHGFAFPIAIEDNQTALERAARAYSPGGIPLIVVVDKKGVVRHVSRGWSESSAAPLESLLSELVAER